MTAKKNKFDFQDTPGPFLTDKAAQRRDAKNARLNERKLPPIDWSKKFQKIGDKSFMFDTIKRAESYKKKHNLIRYKVHELKTFKRVILYNNKKQLQKDVSRHSTSSIISIGLLLLAINMFLGAYLFNKNQILNSVNTKSLTRKKSSKK